MLPSRVCFHTSILTNNGNIMGNFPDYQGFHFSLPFIET
jgi:hypothetical protein